jgi:hypothetical protein
MPGTITRALPIAVTLLALAACSSTTGTSSSANSSASASASNAPYRAACKAEDTAYQQASYILDGNTSSHKAYPVLHSYYEDVSMAESTAIMGSNLWNDLNTESLKLENLSTDLGISTSVTQGNIQEFSTARSAVIDDCKSYGYTDTATTAY